MGTLSRVVDRFVHEVGLPREDSVRIARKLNKFAKSVDWATPVEDDLDKLGRKKRVASKRRSVATKRAKRASKQARPNGTAAKRKRKG